jgi:hypothetical protein
MKEIFPSPAPVNDMIPGTRLFNMQWSTHDLNWHHTPPTKANGRLDPFTEFIAGHGTYLF